MSRKGKAILGILLLSAALISVAVAYVMKQVNIPTTFYIEPSYNIKIYDTDGITELVSLDIGNLERGIAKKLPESGFFFINNTNEEKFWVGFTVQEAPTNMIWEIYVKKGNLTSGQNLYINTSSPETAIYQQVLEGSLTNPDPNTRFAYWFIRVKATEEAVGGSYTAVMVFTAHDNPTG